MATTTTTPTRFDAALFAAAKAAGERTSRTAAQQLAHWVRLGQELEASGAISQRDIDRALAGQISYDDLGAKEQAAVRAGNREQIDATVADLDLEGEFVADGRGQWSEVDETGAVVTRTAAGVKKRPARRRTRG